MFSDPTRPLKNQGEMSKKWLSKTIVHLIKHASFQLYRGYPAEFIWKNRQLATLQAS